jgi:hypothetical protein
MNQPRLTAVREQLLSLAAAAVLTGAVLFSLGVQANHQHAGVLAQAAAASQLCAVPARAERT